MARMDTESINIKPVSAAICHSSGSSPKLVARISRERSLRKPTLCENLRRGTNRDKQDSAMKALAGFLGSSVYSIPPGNAEDNLKIKLGNTKDFCPVLCWGSPGRALDCCIQ